ncbi:hypothetical protein ACQPYA_12250 [Micromonospora sp. CA-263727]|uniref:hypothetical protein n=1 Tax=Micromonospora sp. CA-263727 TaxID=3239967 RepID=UPI003D926EFA
MKRRNSMITDAASPASYASIEAELVSKLLVNGPLADYAIALGRRGIAMLEVGESFGCFGGLALRAGCGH